ncbi:hypothetical protein JMJ35_002794 [Cladonia borealis]|uniref:Uncharacterized protein n=1 Tax=Cladonia borealis TaxID=184061 RepID=A0AA39R3D3_9LECA|nr:hypothetical protein JMJ35_002794 [Cladonia borealis]
MKFQDQFTISCNDNNRDALLSIEQEKYWAQGILGNMQLLQQRSNQIYERSRREMDKLYHIMSLKDSDAIRTNNARLAKIAEYQQESNVDLRQFAWDARQDARLMKFLAEVTMIFLPITAVSTTFSMGFFALDSSSTAVLPFSSIRYIWIFLLLAGSVSMGTWIAWWQRWKELKRDDLRFRERARRRGLEAVKAAEKEADNDPEEVG